MLATHAGDRPRPWHENRPAPAVQRIVPGRPLRSGGSSEGRFPSLTGLFGQAIDKHLEQERAEDLEAYLIRRGYRNSVTTRLAFRREG